jgi:hypothetical protein
MKPRLLAAAARVVDLRPEWGEATSRSFTAALDDLATAIDHERTRNRDRVAKMRARRKGQADG